MSGFGSLGQDEPGGGFFLGWFFLKVSREFLFGYLQSIRCAFKSVYARIGEKKLIFLMGLGIGCNVHELLHQTQLFVIGTK